MFIHHSYSTTRYRNGLIGNHKA